MRIEDLKKLIRYSAILTGALSTFTIVISETPIISTQAYSVFNLSIYITLIFWAFYFRFGWRYRILCKLFDRPDFNGTWFGTVKSDWQDENDMETPEKKFAIVIRQSFLNIHLVTYTNIFEAYSYAETLLLEKERGILKIIYHYTQDPTSIGDDRNREGTAILNVRHSKEKIDGVFWSKSKSNGDIEVKKVSSHHAIDFKHARQLSLGII